MKKIFLTFVFILLGLTSYSQFTFENTFKDEKSRTWTTIGGTYAVLEIEGTTEELYQLVVNWVNETYNDPEEVIISQTDSKFLKIQGSKENLFHSAMASWDAKYRLSFKFKENKVKMEINDLEYYIAPSKYSIISGWQSKNKIATLKKNGKPYGQGTKDLEAITVYFNMLANSLINFKGNPNMQDDDW